MFVVVVIVGIVIDDDVVVVVLISVKIRSVIDEIMLLVMRNAKDDFA